MFLEKTFEFYCMYCGNTYENRRNLFEHITISHFGEESIQNNCYICGYESKDLVKHIIFNHRQTHCEVCSKEKEKIDHKYCKSCNCFLIYGDQLLFWRKFYLKNSNEEVDR